MVATICLRSSCEYVTYVFVPGCLHLSVSLPAFLFTLQPVSPISLIKSFFTTFAFLLHLPVLIAYLDSLNRPAMDPADTYLEAELSDSGLLASGLYPRRLASCLILIPKDPEHLPLLGTRSQTHRSPVMSCTTLTYLPRDSEPQLPESVPHIIASRPR